MSIMNSTVMLQDGHYSLRLPLKSEKKRNKVRYIPHYRVLNPKKESLRVVFDCGETYEGTSFNDHLLQGPNLISSLVVVLLKFRQEPVAFMADIEAMFHQVRVAAQDVDFLSFLLWPGGELIKEPITYRINHDGSA